MIKLLFMLTLLLTCSTSNAELTGNVRKEFLDANVRSCYATQKADKVNQNIEGKLVFQWCKCNTLYMAEKLNNELLISIENGDQKLSPQLIQMAANYCQNDHQKYK